MDMNFKGVDNETAAFVQWYKAKNGHKTLADALRGMARDLQTPQTATGQNKSVVTEPAVQPEPTKQE